MLLEVAGSVWSYALCGQLFCCWGSLGSYGWLLDMTLNPLVGVVAAVCRFIFGGYTSSTSSRCRVGLLELCCELAPQFLYVWPSVVFLPQGCWMLWFVAQALFACYGALFGVCLGEVLSPCP